MTRLLLTAQSEDRPGIVAGLSGVIADHHWSVEDAAMTRLAGRFAMLMVVNAPDDADVDHVRSLLSTQLVHDNVTFTLESIDEDVADLEGDKWTVTVYGSDRPGIVAAVSRVLAKYGVNIDDLSTRVVDLMYMMLIDATVPDSVDGAEFTAELALTGEALGVTCHAAIVDIDVF